MLQRNPTDSFAGVLNETRAASTAAGGTALTTTAQIIPFPLGTSRVAVLVRNFSTAVVAKLALVPWAYILRTDNALGVVTGYSVQAQAPSGTGLTLDALATKANGGAIYVGSHVPFRGLNVTMSGSVNAIASVLTAEYWNGSAWITLSATDGTTSGGATFAQTGLITWTMPAQALWVTDFLLNSRPNAPADQAHQMPHATNKRYWVRLTVSAALSATVSATNLFAMPRSTAYAEMVQDSQLQFRTEKQEEGLAGVEMLTNAGTANAIVNCYTGPKGAFFV